MAPTDDFISPHWEHSALVIVDVQADFVDGAATVPGTAEVLDNLTRLADAFRRHGRPVVHVVRLYDRAGHDVDLVRRALIGSGASVVAPGTEGSQIPPSLLPTRVDLDPDLLLSGALQQVGPTEHVLYKPRWSAFHRTRLQDHLDALGVDTVVVAGCNLPNCPRATLFDATERDYRAVAVTDATSQTTPERLADLALIGVTAVTTDEACRGLQPVTAT
jgi:nicotinamidase-related amidase